MIEFFEIFEDGAESLGITFGEEVTYHFLAGGNVTVEDAIVTREPPALLIGGEMVTAEFIVRIRVSKVSPSQVNTGGDYVMLIPRVGQSTPKRYDVMTLVSQDDNFINVAVK